jgi:hypothetical protein
MDNTELCKDLRQYVTSAMAQLDHLEDGCVDFDAAVDRIEFFGAVLGLCHRELLVVRGGLRAKRKLARQQAKAASVAAKRKAATNA